MQVTLVDASSLLVDFASSELLLDRRLASTPSDQRSIVDLLMDQIEFANVIVLNKMDLVAPADMGKLICLLNKLNPGAEVLPSTFCRVPLHQVLNTKR